MIQEEKKVGDDEPDEHQPPASLKQHQPIESHAHHSGILRSMLERAVANRFSSKPIDMEKNRLAMQQQEQQQHKKQKHQLARMAEEEMKFHNSIQAVNSVTDIPSPTTNTTHNAAATTLDHYPTLTPSEQSYLETLLESEDPKSIRQATLILSDLSLFPQEDLHHNNKGGASSSLEATPTPSTLMRRDSKVQSLLFRMHEIGRVPAVGGEGVDTTTDGNTSRRRLGWNERKEGSTVLDSHTSMSSLLDEKWRNNSIIMSSVRRGSATSINGNNHNHRKGGGNDDDDDVNNDHDDNILASSDEDFPEVQVDRSTSSTTSQDISSWLDGTPPTSCNGGEGGGQQPHHHPHQQVGVEVDSENGVLTSAKLTAESFFKTSFAILGTAADDVSCQPHVLSPPLMESLLEFVPETLSDYHFWIKYSMVRDGANLFSLLRHVRASTRTILAIETTDGQVFGAFASHPWRLVPNLVVQNKSKDDDDNEDDADANANDTSILTCCNEESFYGSKDSFLWKMRQSRFESQALVRSATVEQAILIESELAVYPFTGRNNFVQHCSTDDGIGLGEHASAIRLDPSLRTGSTAASETFGNPCLLEPKSKDPVSFQIANLEVWTLTPHDTVKEAEQAELTTFFQQERQSGHNKRLDILSILVGGPKSKR